MGNNDCKCWRQEVANLNAKGVDESVVKSEQPVTYLITIIDKA